MYFIDKDKKEVNKEDVKIDYVDLGTATKTLSYS